MRLGKAFGVMLTDKKYKWKTYFDSLSQLLDTMFPELRNDSGQTRLHYLRFKLYLKMPNNLEWNLTVWYLLLLFHETRFNQKITLKESNFFLLTVTLCHLISDYYDKIMLNLAQISKNT